MISFPSKRKYDSCNVIYLLLLSFKAKMRTQLSPSKGIFTNYSLTFQKVSVHSIFYLLYWFPLNWRKFCHVFMDLFPNERSTWMMLLFCKFFFCSVYFSYINYRLQCDRWNFALDWSYWFLVKEREFANVYEYLLSDSSFPCKSTMFEKLHTPSTT